MKIVRSVLEIVNTVGVVVSGEFSVEGVRRYRVEDSFNKLK